MIVAHRFVRLNTEIFPGNRSSYVSALSVTTKTDVYGNRNFTYYNSTLCYNVFPNKDDPRLQYLYGYTCPDVPNIDDFFMPIQGSDTFLGFNLALANDF